MKASRRTFIKKSALAIGPIALAPLIWSGTSDAAGDVTKTSLPPNATFIATSKADLENVANAGKVAIISSEIDLGAATVTLQTGMQLYFNGGFFSNGIVTGVNSKIDSNIQQIFASDCTVNGTWKLSVVYPQWFGVKGDAVTDDTALINKCFDFVASIGGGKIVFPTAIYMVNHTAIKPKANTYIDFNGSTIKLIPNNVQTNRIINIYHTNDVVIENVIVQGDRYKHDYSGGGTHEGGIGIAIITSENVVVKKANSFDCTGDSMVVGHARLNYLQNQDVGSGAMAKGGIDAKGVADTGLGGYYTTKFFNLTLITTDYYHFWARSWGGNYNNAFTKMRVFYYDSSNTLLESRDFLMFEHEEKTKDIPSRATKAKVWYIDFTSPSIKARSKIDFGGGRWSSRNITVKDFEFYNSRRQGITVGGVIHGTIENGRIHHIKGTAPQSGIDIEEGVNRYISINNILFDHNKANFQSPSGNFVTFNGCNFQQAVNGSGFSSGIGSVAMNDCVIVNNTTSFDGKSVLNNVLFKDCVISDRSAIPKSFNTKTFNDCTFDGSTLGQWRTGTEFGIVSFNGGVFKDSLLPGDKNIRFSNLSYASTGPNIAGYFNNCKIDISNGGIFHPDTTLKSCEVFRSVTPTAPINIWFQSGVKIYNSTITDYNPTYNGHITVDDNVKIFDAVFDITRNLTNSYSGFDIGGSNVVLNNVRINHTGTITTNKSAIISISGTATASIIKCDFKTNDVNSSKAVYVSGGTPTYDLVNNTFINVVEPTDDTTNRLGGNITLTTDLLP